MLQLLIELNWISNAVFFFFFISYLFIEFMKLFTRMLKQVAIKAKRFKFHSRRERLNLTHLNFVDDLMIFIATYSQSIWIV